MCVGHLDHPSLKSGETELLLKNLLIASNYPRISSSSCCLLLFSINVIEHLDVSFSQSKTVSQLRNRQDFLLSLGPSFFKSDLLPNLKKTVKSELPIMVIQQLEDF